MSITVRLLPAVLLSVAGLAIAQRESPPPLSSVIAVGFKDKKTSIADHVRDLVELYRDGAMAEDAAFPLPPAFTDDVRTIDGLRWNVVISWLEPLSKTPGAAEPRFGANNDYIAYFGDGWNAVEGAPPQWNGSSSAGWLWVNHEYISNSDRVPRVGTAPAGQHAVLADFLHERGLLRVGATSNDWTPDDINAYVRHAKRQVGGSYLRVVSDPGSGRWQVDRSVAGVRYDATSATRLALTGTKIFSPPEKDDDGNDLPAGVVIGIAGDCSGGQSPWGTIFTAEENVQDYYGDLEYCWGKGGKFVAGRGFDSGGPIDPDLSPSAGSEFGRSTEVHGRRARDTMGWLSEIDVGQPPERSYASITNGGDGIGHRKLGSMGRARWENCTFVVDEDWRLLDDQPIVLYAADDRLSGRVYKFVSRGTYHRGMSRAETRALLDEGSVSVAHMEGLDNRTGNTLLLSGAAPNDEAPGQGRWIELSTTSSDEAPNARALGKPGTTTGEALRDASWNGIGGFPSDDHVRLALFTACNKIGVMETNRPEDVEWNPRDPTGPPRIYVAFTKQQSRVSLDQNGVLIPPDDHAAKSPERADPCGFIMAITEEDTAAPARSRRFTYSVAFKGNTDQGAFAAACPDNILIDRNGGVWFGTDGNYVVNGVNDGFYYLDLDPRHKGRDGKLSTFGRAFRILTVPGDAESTGPCFTSDGRSLFISVQHPGEELYSRWPRHGGTR